MANYNWLDTYFWSTSCSSLMIFKKEGQGWNIEKGKNPSATSLLVYTKRPLSVNICSHGKTGPLLGTSLMRLCLFWPVRPQGGFRLVYFSNACKCLAAIRTHTFVCMRFRVNFNYRMNLQPVYTQAPFSRRRWRSFCLLAICFFFLLTAQSRSLWLMM